MTFDLWIACGCLFLVIVPLAHFTIYRRQFKGIEDVVSFARRLSIEDFQRIVDPAEEWLLRRSMLRGEFRQLQRQRMRLCSEYLSRVSHNCELLQGWSLHDHAISASKGSDPADEKTHLLWDLSRTATEARAFALVIRLKVGIWLLLRADLLPVPYIPQLGTLRAAAGLDLLATYQQVTDLAKRVSQFYGPEWAERIRSAF